MVLTQSVVNSLLIGTIIVAAVLILISSLKRTTPKKRRPAHREPRIGSTSHHSKMRPHQHYAVDDLGDDPDLSVRPIPAIPLKQPAQQMPAKRVLSLFVMARSPYRFTGYELLQVLQGNGFRFGKMNIFHYHPAQDIATAPLFSLVSATEPGTFDINNMGAFSCPGLSLFMTVDAHADPENVLALMIDVAKQLADELDGDLLDSRLNTWDRDTEHAYYEAVDAAFV
jgi:cell division protein ZipA